MAVKVGYEIELDTSYKHYISSEVSHNTNACAQNTK